MISKQQNRAQAQGVFLAQGSLCLCNGTQHKSGRTRHQGFTLIELVVVITILGIMTAMAVPSFAGYIDKMKVEELAQKGRIAEEATLALAGMQYARFGNPPLANFTANPAVAEENYLYLDSQASVDLGFSRGNLLVYAPANLGRPIDDGTRTSAGINEFKQRTVTDLPPCDWRIDATSENQKMTSLKIFLYKDVSGVTEDSSGISIPPGTYLNYERAFTYYWITDEGARLLLLHGATIDTTGNISEGTGWNIYRYDDSAGTYALRGSAGD
ncbi:MAG: type II secretion system GspH family protein [Coriobacteriales bacterium]|jgi:prepilin-type N-terminal cleavage/methylation domain-containing protein|nr:type II secretion system GspH family protein [Coriobacteriales bacterium]